MTDLQADRDSDRRIAERLGFEVRGNSMRECDELMQGDDDPEFQAQVSKHSIAALKSIDTALMLVARKYDSDYHSQKQVNQLVMTIGSALWLDGITEADWSELEETAFRALDRAREKRGK